MFANTLRLISRSFATVDLGKVVFRSASAKDIDIMTNRAVSEGWHVGPYDFPCGYAFDPKGFFMCEIDGEVISHGCVTRYPNHSSYVGGHIVKEKFKDSDKDRSILLSTAHKMVDFCDQDYTIGGDMFFDTRTMLEKLGFERKWDTYIAMLSPEKVVENVGKMALPAQIGVKSIRDVKMEKVLEYDQLVFGTARHTFMKKWISSPGHVGWAAVNEKNDDIVGYGVLKQVIRGGGTELGLAMAPLFADDALIAKHLLKVAAEYSLSNEVLPNTNLELFHPFGDICGEDAPQLMNELEAELSHVGYRMYTKGVPLGRQLKKIYGIASPTFD